MIFRAYFLLLTTFILLASAHSGFAQVQHKNIVYAEVHGVGLVMDIFTPTENRNGLAIIDVISGAWNSSRGKIRAHQRAQVFKIMCSHGYTVFAIRPGSSSRFSIPDMAQHLEKGITWVKEQADEYGIDPRRLGMMGASAGGHLASLVAVTNGGSHVNPSIDKATVRAVAVFFPPTDFLKFGRDSGLESADRVRQIALRGVSGKLSVEETEQALISISPARLVTTDSPPFLLIHGTADDVVPQTQSELLQAALKDKGVSAELVLKEGGGHPWPTIHEEVGLIAGWFDGQLGSELSP